MVPGLKEMLPILLNMHCFGFLKNNKKGCIYLFKFMDTKRSSGKHDAKIYSHNEFRFIPVDYVVEVIIICVFV